MEARGKETWKRATLISGAIAIAGWLMSMWYDKRCHDLLGDRVG